MKRAFLFAALLSSAAFAQDTSYRDGDRMAGRITTSPQGQAIAPKVIQIGTDGTAIPAGTAADPIFVSGGGSSGGGNTIDVQGNGTLALATANAVYTIPLSAGRSAVGLTINGLTGSGATITVERSNDGGTTWTNANTTESSTTASLSSTITANGQARVGVAGATNIRLRVSTAGTGTATINYNATAAAGPVFLIGNLPSYSTPDGRIIGGVDNRFINGTAISTGSGATDAGTQRVTLPSDSGLATSSAQTTGNTSLSAIQAQIGATTSPAAGSTNAQLATIIANQTNKTQYAMPVDVNGNSPVVNGGNSDGNSVSTLGYVTYSRMQAYNSTSPAWDRWRFHPGTPNVTAVVAEGGASFATGQIAVPANTATLIVAAGTGAINTTVEVTSAVSCAYGATSAVSLTTGFPLAPTAYAAITLPLTGAVYAICPSAVTVAYARPQ